MIKLVNSIIAAGGRGGRLGHPLRARRPRHARALPHRRRARRRPPRSRAGWWPGVVSRIKIMGDLDIAEKRVPQDGRVGLTVEGDPVDIRVVTHAVRARRGHRDAPARQEPGAAGPGHAGHGGRGRASASRPASTRPTAPCWSPGPTGSGKSTTLYAALNAINSIDKNIITIEDPVEYQLAGINQLQVNNKARADLRPRAALDAARRPRRDHGRRDPRRGDGPDRHRVGPDRAPRALHAAHQRRAVGDHPADRDGHRALPDGLGAGLRRGPAAGAHAVRALQAARPCSRRHALEAAGFAADFDVEAYEPVGCSALRRQRLQGPLRPVRGDERVRGDPRR